MMLASIVLFALFCMKSIWLRHCDLRVFLLFFIPLFQECASHLVIDLQGQWVRHLHALVSGLLPVHRYTQDSGIFLLVGGFSKLTTLSQYWLNDLLLEISNWRRTLNRTACTRSFPFFTLIETVGGFISLIKRLEGQVMSIDCDCYQEST